MKKDVLNIGKPGLKKKMIDQEVSNEGS